MTESVDQLAGPLSKRRRIIQAAGGSDSIPAVQQPLAAGVCSDHVGDHRQVREDRRAIVRDIYASYCALNAESTIGASRDSSLFKSLLALAKGTIAAAHAMFVTHSSLSLRHAGQFFFSQHRPHVLWLSVVCCCCYSSNTMTDPNFVAGAPSEPLGVAKQRLASKLLPRFLHKSHEHLDSTLNVLLQLYGQQATALPQPAWASFPAAVQGASLTTPVPGYILPRAAASTATEAATIQQHEKPPPVSNARPIIAVSAVLPSADTVDVSNTTTAVHTDIELESPASQTPLNSKSSTVQSPALTATPTSVQPAASIPQPASGPILAEAFAAGVSLGTPYSLPSCLQWLPLRSPSEAQLALQTRRDALMGLFQVLEVSVKLADKAVPTMLRLCTFLVR